MVEKAKTFKIGDKVFGKVKGYPAWPARITSISGKRYGVIFYGTNEIATLKQDDVFYYLSNKKKFPMQKRKFYAEAVQDIELDIEHAGGSDGNDNPVSDSSQEDGSVAQSKGGKRKRSSIVSKKTVENSKRIKLGIQKDQKYSEDDNLKESTETKEASKTNAIVEENVEANKKIQSQSSLDGFVTKVKPTNTINNDSTTKIYSKVVHDHEEIASDDEVIKKAEQEIMGVCDTNKDKIEKPLNEGVHLKQAAELEENQYNSGELNLKDVNLLSDFYLTAITRYAERVADSSHYYQINKPDPISLDKAEDARLKVLPVKLSPNKYCGLIYAPKPTNSYKCEYDRAMDDAQIVQDLLELKAEVTVGNLNHHDHRFIEKLRCDDTYVQNETSLQVVAYKSAKLDWLQREMEPFKLLVDVKKCLGMKEAKTKKALKLLQQLLDCHFEPISLKKRSYLVEDVVRLRVYVGNPQEWTLDDQQMEQFEEDAGNIRRLAEQIMAKLMKLFSYGDKVPEFMDKFEEECDLFNDATKSMSEGEVFSLCGEPHSRKAQLELIFDEQAIQNNSETSATMYTPE